MTAEIRIAGVLIENRVKLNDEQDQGIVGLPSAAWYGEVSTAGIVIEDPDGDFEIEPFSTFTFDETDCTAKPRVFTGWITAKRYRRGKFSQGVGREIDCDIFDQNYLFHLQVFRASSAKRPAETDIVRADFCRNSAPMAFTPLADNGRWNTTDNATAFGPSDYVKQYPNQLMESIAGISGKNFYAYWDNDAEEISGHYDLIGTNPLSDIRISNVIADSDSDTFYPFRDAELVRTPEKLITGLLYGYLGGNYVFVENESLIGPNEFSPVNMKREDVYQTDRVGRAETAAAQAAAQLAARAKEVDTIACAITVPSSQVNLLHAGDSAETKFIHLGDTDFVTRDVIRRNVVPHNGRRDKWDIHLQLSNSIKQTGPGGGDPGEGPFEESCDIANVDLVQSAHGQISSPVLGTIQGASWASPPVAGHLLVCIWASFGQQLQDVGTMVGWNLVDKNIDFVGAGGSGGTVSMFYKVAESGEDTTPQATSNTWSSSNRAKSQNYLLEFDGVDSLDAFTSYVNDGGPVETPALHGAVTPTAGKVALGVTIVEYATSLGGSLVPVAGATEVYEEPNISDSGNPWRFVVYAPIEETSGSYNISGTWTGGSGAHWIMISAIFTCSGSGGVPGALMNVRDETVTMVGDTGTTRFPFTAGSLEVFVDNTNQTAAIIDQDPEAGTFQLGFTPTPTEQVVVNYQANVGGPGT